MRRIQSRITPMSAALAAIAVAASPGRALAAGPATDGRPHPRVAAVHATRSGEPGDAGSRGSVTTGASGSDDGGSDDSVTTRTSRLKPVGGQGPLLGGGSAPTAHKHHAHHHPRTRTSGLGNGGGDN
jgi:hypothetical protein